MRLYICVWVSGCMYVCLISMYIYKYNSNSKIKQFDKQKYFIKLLHHCIFKVLKIIYHLTMHRITSYYNSYTIFYTINS